MPILPIFRSCGTPTVGDVERFIARALYQTQGYVDELSDRRITAGRRELIVASLSAQLRHMNSLRELYPSLDWQPLRTLTYSAVTACERHYAAV